MMPKIIISVFEINDNLLIKKLTPEFPILKLLYKAFKSEGEFSHTKCFNINFRIQN